MKRCAIAHNIPEATPQKSTTGNENKRAIERIITIEKTRKMMTLIKQ
jgi:hypothetical protein